MQIPLLVCFALVASSALADTVSTTSKQFCHTALRPQKGDVGTTTKVSTVYFTKTIKTTITPTSTITPKSATVTTTSTVTTSTTTTLPQTTDTFSETQSFTITDSASTTLLFTSTSTAYESTTTTLDTTTIAASAGFVPLASALSAQGHAASKKHKRGVQDLARDANPGPRLGKHRASSTSQKIICGSDGSITYDPPAYKGSVTCYKRVQIVTTKTVTSTARFPRTITASRGTTTSVQYTTLTNTITETPIAASTTLTFSTTESITTTATLSSTVVVPYTTTSTIYGPQPTFYAACASNNAVSFVDNNRIYNIAVADPNNGFSFGNSTTTAYDCCTQCVLSTNCGGTTFHPASGTCYLFPVVGGTCSPTTQSGTFSVQSGTRVGFVVGDSNCGELALL